MNRDETVELFLKGREAWNTWAEGLLAERKALVAARVWKAHRKRPWNSEEGENQETQAWLKKAEADFSGYHFLILGVGEFNRQPGKSIELRTDHIDFSGFVFPGNARFQSATFAVQVKFDEAIFYGDAQFNKATFDDDAIFKRTRFKQLAGFPLASFKRYASFAGSHFEALPADFAAISSESGFGMADAVFEQVPNFIQAHFAEAPRLDDVKVHARRVTRHPQPDRKEADSRGLNAWYKVRHWGGLVRTWPVRAAKGAWRRVWVGNSNIPASWRALKRLAIQGHDAERELEFHARELQSQRFESDWPLPLRRGGWLFAGARASEEKSPAIGPDRFQDSIWPLPAGFLSPASWAGFLRFWFGMFYGLFSDFGRSIFRPFLLWWATIAVFAMYFLSGQPDVLERRRAAEPQGAAPSAVAYVKLVPSLLRDPPPCYAGAPAKDGKPDPEKLTGLAAPVAASTNALAEAFRLAIRNGSIFLDGGDDPARRTYGCLYGIQSFGGTPAPFVPGFVSDASGLQKILSALYIFLFGLALRNMLKMK